jgi:ComF family protein
MFDAAKNSLVRLLLEPACAACNAMLERPLASAICDRCWFGITGVAPPWCARCGDELPAWQSGDAECARCLSNPPHFAIARSAGRYEGPLREIVHAFKYRHRRLLAEPLGRMMRLAGADVLDGADAVVPVPLHPVRSLRRGFNQADDLARQLGLPVWRALRRRRRGPPQAGLPAAARQRNLASAFGISATWTVRALVTGPSLRDRVVVVVDDVMTTGATIEACSRVLLEAGVRSVRALTAARAVTSASQSTSMRRN